MPLLQRKKQPPAAVGLRRGHNNLIIRFTLLWLITLLLKSSTPATPMFAPTPAGPYKANSTHIGSMDSEKYGAAFQKSLQKGIAEAIREGIKEGKKKPWNVWFYIKWTVIIGGCAVVALYVLPPIIKAVEKMSTSFKSFTRLCHEKFQKLHTLIEGLPEIINRIQQLYSKFNFLLDLLEGSAQQQKVPPVPDFPVAESGKDRHEIEKEDGDNKHIIEIFASPRRRKRQQDEPLAYRTGAFNSLIIIPIWQYPRKHRHLRPLFQSTPQSLDSSDSDEAPREDPPQDDTNQIDDQDQPKVTLKEVSTSKEFAFSTPVIQVAYSPNGQQIAALLQNGAIHLFTSNPLKFERQIDMDGSWIKVLKIIQHWRRPQNNVMPYGLVKIIGRYVALVPEKKITSMAFNNKDNLYVLHKHDLCKLTPKKNNIEPPIRIKNTNKVHSFEMDFQRKEVYCLTYTKNNNTEFQPGYLCINTDENKIWRVRGPNNELQKERLLLSFPLNTYWYIKMLQEMALKNNQVAQNKHFFDIVDYATISDCNISSCTRFLYIVIHHEVCTCGSLKLMITKDYKKSKNDKFRFIPKLTSLALFKRKAVFGYNTGRIEEVSDARFLEKYNAGLHECPTCQEQQSRNNGWSLNPVNGILWAVKNIWG